MFHLEFTPFWGKRKPWGRHNTWIRMCPSQWVWPEVPCEGAFPNPQGSPEFELCRESGLAALPGTEAVTAGSADIFLTCYPGCSLPIPPVRSPHCHWPSSECRIDQITSQIPAPHSGASHCFLPPSSSWPGVSFLSLSLQTEFPLPPACQISLPSGTLPTSLPLPERPPPLSLTLHLANSYTSWIIASSPKPPLPPPQKGIFP